MRRFVLDAQYFISYGQDAFDDSRCVISDVVLLELMRSASDDDEFKRLKLIREVSKQDGSLLPVQHDNWASASRVLYLLNKQRRRDNMGLAPRLSPERNQRLAFDALIAASAVSGNVTVVTDNADDFNALKYYMKDLRTMTARQYQALKNR